MRLFVGNFPWTTTEDDLRDLFTEFGSLKSVAIIHDRETRKSRGFGFVEYDSRDDGEDAMDALNETSFQGRKLRISEAEPRT